MARELFEFWCSTAGGGCGGYFRLRLRTDINGAYTVVCPNCGHHHNREIKDGVVTSDRRNDVRHIDTIVVPRAAFSEKPIMPYRYEQVDGPPAVVVVNGKAQKSVKTISSLSETAVLVDGKTKSKLLWDRFVGKPQ